MLAGLENAFANVKIALAGVLFRGHRRQRPRESNENHVAASGIHVRTSQIHVLPTRIQVHPYATLHSDQRSADSGERKIHSRPRTRTLREHDDTLSGT